MLHPARRLLFRLLSLSAAFLAALLASSAAAAAQIPGDQLPMHVLQGGTTLQGFGTAACGPGDVNGDAWADIVVGVPDTDTEGTGGIEVYSGRDGSLLYKLRGSMPGGEFGGTLAAVGDVDHDGRGDFLVGAPQAQTIDLLSGASGATLHHFAPPPGLGHFGRGIVGPGDVDGDGTPDLLFAVGLPDTGAFSVVSGVTFLPLVWKVGLGPDDHYGTQVAAAGDVNADGRADYLVQSWVMVWGPVPFFTCFSGADASVLFTMEGATSAGVAGDMDGDGFGELIFGHNAYQPHSFEYGMLQVYSWKLESALFWTSGTEVFEHFGARVGGVGDVDFDGVPDFFATSPGAGYTTVYSSASETPILRVYADESSPGLGLIAEPAGDVNGDGRCDLLLGSGTEQVLQATGLDGLVTVQVLAPPCAWLGQGLDGTGPAPILSFIGTLQAGTTLSIALAGAQPGAAAVVVLGLDQLGLPFKGGTLVPAPDVVIAGLGVGADGTILLNGRLPTSLPPRTSIYVQAWLADAGGPAGFAASNALHAMTD
ncbi:MAG TPA: integrin alpha [Planctomycetota bacterium]|nr:integrin alpha [Planctomycetota bacterium]